MENSTENEYYPAESTLKSGQKWIDDEGFLRDEGVLFGYSNTSPDEKLEAIDHYYKSITDPIRLKIGLNSNEELRINENIADASAQIYQSQLNQIDNISNYFFRNILGLLLTAGACFFNYFLIEYDLKSLENNTSFIPIGVYLFGIFMTFMPLNVLFHSSDDVIPSSKSLMYLYLLEFGVPLVSSAFVGYQVFVHKGILSAVIHFIFIIFLFIIPGKLFLSMMKQVTDDLKRIKQNRMNKKLNKMHDKKFYDGIEGQKQQLILLNQTLKMEISSRYKNEQEIARLEEEKENKKKLFMSEYNLARTFSERFNARSESAYLMQLKSS